MMPKLQLAVDTAACNTLFDIVDPAWDVVDILEIGTPVIMREGLKPVRMVKEKYPGLTVLADTKIVDGGSLECGYAVEAGADIVTVLALADNETIRAVANTAHEAGKKVMADLICVTDICGRAGELMPLGVDFISVHTGVDAQKNGRTPYDDLKCLVKAVPAEMCAVAGGISLETIRSYSALCPGIIIAGSALCKAPDIREAALEMKRRMHLSI